jgi:hypothetical protein
VEILIRFENGKLQLGAKGVADVVATLLDVIKVIRAQEQAEKAPAVQPAPPGFLAGK